jgi:hypothetical protein
MKSKRVWAGHVARLGRMRNPYNIMVGKHEGKCSPGRLRRRWENIRRYITEIGWEGVEWIHLGQGGDQ